jgi:spore coat polysaccharide biosynthesis predicted glycosyltransferase SpsG
MAELIVQNDLAIGAAGGSAWERCCLGLPSLVFVIADNQKAGAAALEKAGATVTLNNIYEIKPFIQKHLLMNGTNAMRALSEAAALVTDGTGTERVIDCMELLSA